jgi:4-amino-4-deoxy-L-arabinose transferase-like glycosyltransferase
VIARHGWPFINEFFVQHHFARYFSNKYQHPQPIYFYLPVILMLALPWTVFLIDSLARIKQWERHGDDSLNVARVLALAWFVVPILFFSFSGSKLPAYVLPSLPAAALLIGERVTAFVRGHGTVTTMRITAVTCLVLAAGGAIFARSSGKVPVACVVLLAATAAVAALISFFLASKRTVAVSSISAVPVVVTLIALNCGAGAIGARNSVRDLIRRADAGGYNSARLLMFNRIERTSEFYASGRVIYGSDGDPVKVENPDEVVAELRKNNGPVLMIVPLGSLTRLQNMQAIAVQVIADNGRNAIVGVDMKR